MCEKKVVAVVPSCLKKRKNEDNRDNNDNIFIPELMCEKKVVAVVPSCLLKNVRRHR